MWIQFIFLLASQSGAFLPRGRGALILMFGGLAMLALALAGSIATRKQRTNAAATLREAPPRAPSVAPRPTRPPARKEAQWVQKARTAVGGFKIVSTTGERALVALTKCPDCAIDAEVKRCGNALRLLSSAAPEHVAVTEVACRRNRAAECRFEFRRRAR